MAPLLAIVAPMAREVSGLIRLVRAGEGGRTGDRQQSHVLIRVTGVGKERSLAGVEALLEEPRSPDFILSLGFGGALRDELATGDLVLSQRLFAAGEEAWLECDSRILGVARQVLDDSETLPYVAADTITVPEPVFSASEKARLASDTGAWVANMEDYWLGKVAVQRGIPFLSVRAVLDTARQELPAFVAGLGGKGPMSQAVSVLARGVLRPGNVGSLRVLSKQVRVARDNLTAFALSFATRIEAAGSYASLPTKVEFAGGIHE